MLQGLIHDFRIGVQASDKQATDEFGIFRYSNWLSDMPYWSTWATDANGYDPDAIRLHLEKKSWLKVEPLDFCVGIILADRGGLSEEGTPRFTPWASEGGGWSDFASDSNQYDPDAIRVILKWRRWQARPDNKVLKDLRIGIQLFDNRGQSEAGEPCFTPWLIQGGLSPWAMDANKKDFDGAKIGLEVRLAVIGEYDNPS